MGPRGPNWCTAGALHGQILLSPKLCRLSWELSLSQDTTKRSTRRQDLILAQLCSLMPMDAVASSIFHCFVPFTPAGPAQLACISPRSSCELRADQPREHSKGKEAGTHQGGEVSWSFRVQVSVIAQTQLKNCTAAVCDPHLGQSRTGLRDCHMSPGLTSLC